MTYAAKSLEDIAKAFEHCAWQATAFSDRLHKTKRDKMLAERENRTWMRAAQMLRETTLETASEAETEIDCGQCEGTGTTDAIGYSEECPVCDGSGRIKKEDE